MVTNAETRRPYAPRMTPEDRREQLLDAVLQVVVARGVHKVSIESVAEAAGVTRPVVYKHFDDSDALLRASLLREEVRAVEQYRAAIAQTGAQAGPSEFALAMFENLLTMFQAAPDLWRAILQLADSTTPEFRRTLDRGREQVVVLLDEALTSGLRVDGAEGGTDTELAARMIIALVIESGRLLLSRPGEFPRERLVTGARDVLARITG